VSADGSWSVCTHEHLTDRCSLCACACYHVVMSADGSWSVCTHEHLPDRCSLLSASLPRQSCRQMVHGVFAPRTSDRSLFFCSALATARHVSRWFMDVCTHEHLPERCSLAMRLLPASLMCSRMFMECLHSRNCLPDRSPSLHSLAALVVSRWFMEYCIHEHLGTLFSRLCTCHR
jgi:hypothetical protein